MDPVPRWRLARFNVEEQRREFIAHAQAIGIDGVEVEPLDELRVRFRAPARYEIGLAGMVLAHGGKVLPSLEVPEPVRRAGSL